MATLLSKEDRARFSRDGFLSPIQALDPQEASELLAHLEGIESARGGRLPALFNAKPHLLIRRLWDLVHSPRIVDCVADLLGPDLLCWGSTFLAKSPSDGRRLGWHQDVAYWGLSAPEAVTAWVAFTPSNEENGCVRMIPGSNSAALEHVTHSNVLDRTQKNIPDVDESNAVDLVLAPGQMSLHDCLVVHGSNVNRSCGRRIGFVIRYIPSHLHQLAGDRTSATLVRGRDHGGFDLETAPEGDFDPAALGRHPEIIRHARSAVSDGYFLGLLKTQETNAGRGAT